LPDTAAKWRPGRNVLALSLVSLLTDASSEIIAPLLPLFLTGVLGASVRTVGTIEGGAEAVASLVKLASGWWSDRAGRRKPLIVFGYGLASLVRPLVAFAQTAPQVLAIRLTDRVGKGVRGAPRDALLAASTPVAFRGRAFGFHRASDHAGAVIGPLIALACLNWLGMPLRHVFLVAAVPGAMAVLVAVFWVREKQPPASATVADRTPGPGAHTDATISTPGAVAAHTNQSPGTPPAATPTLPRSFAHVMIPIALFTLGNSTDAFLILRANQLGVPVAMIPLLWIALHVVKSAASTPGGALSDRVGRTPLIIGGWLLYAAVYAGFAMATASWHVWALFALYGVVFGMSEGTEKALIADMVPSAIRGRAFGWYHATIGLAALPASVLFGAVWDRYGASTAFIMGAVLAVMASSGLALVRVRPPVTS
jgi:MFS family permease